MFLQVEHNGGDAGGGLEVHQAEQHLAPATQNNSSSR